MDRGKVGRACSQGGQEPLKLVRGRGGERPLKERIVRRTREGLPVVARRPKGRKVERERDGEGKGWLTSRGKEGDWLRQY